MTLYSAKQFSVDSHGAYLVSLEDDKGKPILFERTEIDGKRRGGSHVCFPYFGADAAGVLPQHGFGRDVEWKVDVMDDTEVSCFYMQWDDDGQLNGLSASIIYKLYPEANEFHTSIVISNPFPRTGPLVVSPGFHPYFAVDSANVKLNREPVDLREFEPFKEYPDTSALTIESRGRTVTVSSNNLRHMVVWTDLKGDYLCVEPTLSGHSFNSADPVGNLLEPANYVQYGYAIKWE